MFDSSASALTAEVNSAFEGAGAMFDAFLAGIGLVVPGQGAIVGSTALHFVRKSKARRVETFWSVDGLAAQIDAYNGELQREFGLTDEDLAALGGQAS